MSGQDGLGSGKLSFSDRLALKHFNQIAHDLNEKHQRANLVYAALSDALTATHILVPPSDIRVWHNKEKQKIETSRVISLSVNAALSAREATYLIDIQDEGLTRLSQKTGNTNTLLSVIPFATTTDQTISILILSLRRLHPKLNRYFHSAQENVLKANP